MTRVVTPEPAVHPAFDCRQWWYYVVPMPLTADDQGPATVGVDAAKMHYEVWDQDFVTHGSFDFLPDAINYAMALNYELPAVQPAPVAVQTVLSNPLKDRGKMIKPFPGAPAGGYPLTPNPVDVSQGRETDCKPSVDLTPEAVARLVKPLEWGPADRNGGLYASVAIHNQFTGYYQITQEEYGLATVEFGIHCHEFGGNTIWKGPSSDAQAAANADNAARVLASIDTALIAELVDAAKHACEWARENRAEFVALEEVLAKMKGGA